METESAVRACRLLLPHQAEKCNADITISPARSCPGSSSCTSKLLPDHNWYPAAHLRMGIGEKTLRSLHIRKHGTHESVAEPTAADRELLVKVLTSGSRNGTPSTGDYGMFDTYITYLCDRLLSGCEDKNITLHSLIVHFAIVVEYFTATRRVKNTIEEFLTDKREEIAEIFPTAEMDEKDWRRSRLTDTVNAIALWLMIEDFGTLFHNQRVRKNFFEYNEKHATKLATNDKELEDQGKFNIPAFAEIAGLMPKIAPWVTAPEANPYQEIPKSDLNVRLILRVGQIKINWTFDLSKHLKFEHSTLYLFCMPSRLMFEPGMQEADTPDKALTQMGFSRSYVEEVKHSYLLLFGPKFRAHFEDEFASENLPQPKDPYLRTICLRSPDHANLDKLESWLKPEFSYLWPRIKELEQHVRNIRPDSFWKLLYRDRRDSLAWYTFVFAVLVLILTFLSTAFTGIQTVKAFLPSSPPATSGQSSAAAAQTTVTSPATSPIPRTTVLTSSTTRQTGFASTSVFTSASPTVTVQPSTSSSDLSGGAIAGIAVGIFFPVALLLSGLVFIITRRMRRKMGKQRKLAVSKTYDPESSAKAPSYAFSPGPMSDILPPDRQFTELSGSSDASTTEFRAQYVRSSVGPGYSMGPESSRQLPRAITVVM